MHHLTPNSCGLKALLLKFRLYFNMSLLVFVLGLTGGCANRAMNHAIASWQDQQLSEVIAAWGNPSEELKIEGKQLLIWNTHEGKAAPAGMKRPSPPPNAGACVRLLQADRKGRIVAGTWDGNDCPGWFSGWARW